jgi:hypothetical protein
MSVAREWDSRRRAPRRGADLYAVVKFGIVVQPARIKDVSIGGMRLEGIGGLRRGTPLVVELISGKQYQGEVAWSSDNRLGVRLRTAISTSDPILNGRMF